MTTPLEWTVGAAIGALVTVLVYKRLGPERSRDPMLLIGSFFVALRLVLTFSNLLVHGTFDITWALVTVAVAYFVRRRWRMFETPGVSGLLVRE